MKIKIIPEVPDGQNPATPIILSVGYTESPGNFRITTERLLQICEYHDSDYVDIIDRKNRRTTVTFTITRLHTTIEDSEDHILRHEAQFPIRGTVVFESQGDTATTRTMTGAVIAVVDSSYQGATSYTTYQILGPKIV